MYLNSQLQQDRYLTPIDIQRSNVHDREGKHFRFDMPGKKYEEELDLIDRIQLEDDLARLSMGMLAQRTDTANHSGRICVLAA